MKEKRGSFCREKRKREYRKNQDTNFSKFSFVDPKKEEETKSDKRSCIFIVTQRRREHIHAPGRERFSLLPREGENTVVPKERTKEKKEVFEKTQGSTILCPKKKIKGRKKFLGIPEETRTNILGGMDKASQERKRGVLRKHDYKEHTGNKRILRIW